MALNSLRDLYIDELKDMYNAEKQLVKALPKLAKKASAPELRSTFEEHLAQTQEHVLRIEQVLTQLGLAERGKTCKGIGGIIREGAQLMEEDAEPAVMDAGLIAGGQRVEHYEMAAYGSLRAFAETLGLTNAARLHQETLDEEKMADQKLSELAEGFINSLAEEPAETPSEEGEFAMAEEHSV
jgi:ferritin-like metal-binding protein YciE